MPPVTTGSLIRIQDTISPTDIGGTVGDVSSRWWMVSLTLPHTGHTLLLVSQLAAVYHSTYSLFNYFLSPHLIPHAFGSKFVVFNDK